MAMLSRRNTGGQQTGTGVGRYSPPSVGVPVPSAEVVQPKKRITGQMGIDPISRASASGDCRLDAGAPQGPRTKAKTARNNEDHEQRLVEALKALRVMRIIPLWGVIQQDDGQYRCECRKGPLCRTPGKHPRSKGWQQSATSEPAVVVKWLEQYPDMNFGGVTGEVLGVDVDVKRQKDGTTSNGPMTIEIMEQYNAERVPDTVRARSGRDDRSYHLYFACPKELRPGPRSEILAGVDVRGYGGLLVLPGSRHLSGRLYEWEGLCAPDEVVPAAPPSWLLPHLEQTGSAPTEHVSSPEQECDQRLRKEYGIYIHDFVIRRGAKPPTWKLKDLLSPRKQNRHVIRATWQMARGEGSKYPLRDTSSSGYEMALAVYAACNGWKPQEIVNLLGYWRQRNALDPAKLQRARLTATLRKAFTRALTNGRLRKVGRPISMLRMHVQNVLDERPELVHSSPKAVARAADVTGPAARKVIQRELSRRRSPRCDPK
jgi:hypothetical protein